MSRSKASSEEPSPARPGAPGEEAKAPARVEPARDDGRAVAPGNVDIPRAASVAFGAAPLLPALRPRSVDGLAGKPAIQIDKLAMYALAAWCARLLARPAPSELDALKRLLEEAARLREVLVVAADALAEEGVVDAQRVAEIRRGRGHVDTANDLVALAALFREVWERVKNRTTVAWEDVERASRLGPELLVALGARLPPALPALEAGDATERWARAFALLSSGHEACRRAVSHQRWSQGDAAATVLSSLARGGGHEPKAEAKNAAGEGGSGGGDGASEGPGAPGGASPPDSTLA